MPARRQTAPGTPVFPMKRTPDPSIESLCGGLAHKAKILSTIRSDETAGPIDFSLLGKMLRRTFPLMVRTPVVDR
jgi:hypothetical protein